MRNARCSYPGSTFLELGEASREAAWEFSSMPTCMCQRWINSHEIVLDVFQKKKPAAEYSLLRALILKQKLKVWFQNGSRVYFSLRNFRSYEVVGYFSYLLWWKMALRFMAWYLMFSFRVSLACQGLLTPSELKHVNGCSQSCPYLHVCEWEILQLHESTVKLIRLCRVCNMLFINLTGFCLSFSDVPAS